MRLSDAIDHYLSKVGPNRLKDRTLKQAHNTLKMWRRELGPKTPLLMITTGRVVSVRDNARKPATANRWVSVLSSMLDACVEREWVRENVCRRIQPLRVDNSDVGKLISPTDEQIMKERARQINTDLYVLLCIAFESGARLSEIEGLMSDTVDLSNRFFTFLSTKNGSDRVVPMSHELSRLIQDNGIPGRLIRSQFNYVIKPLSEHIRFHDIRHTMISRALERGVPITLLGKMVGHKTLAMTIRYQHTTVDPLRFIVE